MKSGKITGHPWFWLIAALVITAGTLFSTTNNGWVNWDDDAYVLNNPHVKSLSSEAIASSFEFTRQDVGNYHPITMLTLSINYAISGSDATAYHVTNLVLHLLNVVLLFYFIKLLCGSSMIAFITATLFGIHPMHLESVAWISGRKDVLYTFFFLAGLIAYIRFIKLKGKGYYIACALLLILSMLSKAQAMVFPVILLLIDYYLKREDWKKLFIEKIPFFMISLFFAILAVRQQSVSGSFGETPGVAFHESLFVGCYGTVMYLIKSIAPFQLSAYHPYPTLPGEGIPWYFYASAIPVLAMLWLLWKVVKKQRELFFGFVFFLICLVPVAQVLPMGSAVIAERYTYVAYIGLFFVMAHFMVKWSIDFEHHQKAIFGGAVLFVLVLSGITLNRTHVWKSGKTLWTDVIEKYPDDFFAYGKRGDYFYLNAQFEKALEDYNKSIELNTHYPDVYANRGLIHMTLNDYEKAFVDLNRAIQLNPKFGAAYVNRGIVYQHFDRNELALSDYNKAQKLIPNEPKVYLNRGVIHKRLGNYKAAIADYSKALEFNPRDASIYYNRGFVYFKAEDFQSAIMDFTQSIALKHDYANAYEYRSYALHGAGRDTEALADAVKAMDLGNRMDKRYLELLRSRP